MSIIERALLVVCLFVPMSFVSADTLGDIGNVIIGSQRSGSAEVAGAERRKRSIDANARRQTASIDVLIERNNRHINEDLDPELRQAQLDLRALERDHTSGAISRSEYTSQKWTLDHHISDLRDSIDRLQEQNADYVRRQDEISRDAEDQKAQVDTDTRENVERSSPANGILDQLIRGAGH